MSRFPTFYQPNGEGFQLSPGKSVGTKTPPSWLPTECRQMYQIVVGHSLDRLAGFAPGRQATHDDKGVESLLAK